MLMDNLNEAISMKSDHMKETHSPTKSGALSSCPGMHTCIKIDFALTSAIDG